MECFNCGISESKARLFDVVSSKGIVKICDVCFKNERMPIVRRPTTFQLKESEKNLSIYDRLSKISGIKEELRKDSKTEINLSKIVDRNFESKVSNEKRPRPDLVDNFHWIIMRVRRLKKLTQKKLAQEISESEVAIKMAERGVLPEDDYRLVNKLESFLGIKIIKTKIQKLPEKQPVRIIEFDPSSVQNLTIADLKRIKEEKEAAIFKTNEEDTKESEAGTEKTH
ncbi:MAG TPA: hypothetical protein ENI22_00720 [Candidatus Pacearchaeota archaeon]|nr:hypothetical protein [Candidatus Pacearchaeota archaeon]